MKNFLFVSLILLLFQSCIDSKVEDIAAYEFDNAWYWVGQYKEGATKEEVLQYVHHNTNPQKTGFFFIFAPDKDISIFKEQPFNQSGFVEKIVEMNPEYGYYKMPNSELQDDALWLMQQSID